MDANELGIRSFVVRPSYIQAMQFTEGNAGNVARWCGGQVHRDYKASDVTDVFTYLLVPTILNPLRVVLTEWLIKNDLGQYEKLSDKEFTKKYREVPNGS